MLGNIKKAIRLLQYFRVWAKFAGWKVAWSYLLYRAKTVFGLPQASSVTLQPRQSKYPLTVRLGGSSDMSVLRQIFLEEEYGCLRTISLPALILDLGANVGYSSAFFLSCFPNATVVAVEPDPENFDVCRKNLAPYADRAKIVLGAVWSKRCKLALSRGTFGDGRGWATQVVESEGKENEATVEAWDVAGLRRMGGGKSIDLLKVDIERSELEVFGESSLSWLREVRNICIELHGADCQEVFLRALNGFVYHLETSGELTICRDLQ